MLKKFLPLAALLLSAVAAAQESPQPGVWFCGWDFDERSENGNRICTSVCAGLPLDWTPTPKEWLCPNVALDIPEWNFPECSRILEATVPVNCYAPGTDPRVARGPVRGSWECGGGFDGAGNAICGARCGQPVRFAVHPAERMLCGSAALGIGRDALWACEDLLDELAPATCYPSGSSLALLNGDHAVAVAWEPAGFPAASSWEGRPWPDAPVAVAAVDYEIEREVNGAGFSALATVSAGTVAYLDVRGVFYRDAGVSGGWTVSYRVRALGTADNAWAESNAVRIPQDPCGAQLRTAGPRGTCGACDAAVAHELPGNAFLGLPAACIKKATAAPDDEEFAQDDATVCRAFGGVLQDAAGGRQVCSGVDAADTFCITEAAGASPAFPCRGLFKHVRRCNFEFNRPALNPFLCGPRCVGGYAAGRHEVGCR